MRKKLAIGVGTALLAAGLFLALRPRPFPVEAVTVSQGPFHQTVEEDGKTRVRECYAVSAPVAGTLARIDLRAGDPVEPGSLLARLYPLASPLLDPRFRKVAGDRLASARAAQGQAKAAQSRAETAAALARSNLDRARNLVSKQALPMRELEQAEAEDRMRQSEFESARFAEKVAAHAVEEAQAALQTFGAKSGASEQVRLTSPVRGRVLRVFHESGGVVAAGEPLLELGDPASLEAVVPVLSQDAVTVRPGMPAILTHWGGVGEIHARVRRVEPAAFTRISALGVEEQRVNVVLDIDAPGRAEAQLGDGFALEARILTWSRDQVVQVPTSALFRHGEGWAVFLVTGGRVLLRPVEVGHRGPLAAEILGGLAVGDVVVAHPAPTLRPGARVRLFEG